MAADLCTCDSPRVMSGSCRTRSRCHGLATGSIGAIATITSCRTSGRPPAAVSATADGRATSSSRFACECRPRIELPPVLVREAADAERAAALDLFRRDFGRSGLVAFGQVMDLDAAPAIVADMDGEIGGALAYRLIEGGLHIVALAT